MTERTVRVVRTDQQGHLRITGRPAQSLDSGDVRIAVHATAINPIDEYVVNGFAREHGWAEPGNLGIGWDLSGVISEVGPGVSDPALTIGTRVAALAAGPVKEVGAHAEEIVLSAAAVAPLPDELDIVDAASAPLNILTADQSLDLIGPASGTVLVTGIAGGVGGYAAPLARDRGWQVVGLGRETDRDYAESVGAELITELPDARNAFDAVIDTANMGTVAAQTVRHGGTIVELVSGNTADVDGVTTRTVMVEANGSGLSKLLRDAAAGTLPIRVRATYPLAEIEKAYTDFRSGGRGRVVLTTATDPAGPVSPGDRVAQAPSAASTIHR